MASNVNSNYHCHSTNFNSLAEPMDIPEESFATDRSNSVDTQFDTIIGHIEDIFIGPEFQTLQTQFLDENYCHFDVDEENKFIYTEIHKQYTQLVEMYLMAELKNRMPEFDMKQFLAELTSRRAELEGEVFEVLLTFTDFMTFKEMMLDHKNIREGDAIDLSSGIIVTHITCPSDMMGLTISGISSHSLTN